MFKGCGNDISNERKVVLNLTASYLILKLTVTILLFSLSKSTDKVLTHTMLGVISADDKLIFFFFFFFFFFFAGK